MKNKNCAFFYFLDHVLVNPLRNTVVQKHFYNVEESHHRAFAVHWGERCASIPRALSSDSSCRQQRELFNSHNSPEDRGTPEKAEMTSPVTLSGNSPARLDLFLAMLFFFSPSATFNKCATVFKTPLTTIKGEMLRIRPYGDYILVELQVF